MLTIRLLGEMNVDRDGANIPLPPSRRTRALLAYLVLSPRPLRRDRLSVLFWESPDDLKGALRWSLSKLRSILDEPGCTRILANRDTVFFERSGARIDVVDAKAQIDSGTKLGVTEFSALARSFHGEFLEGLSLPDQHDFEAWKIARREEARGLHKQVLAGLVAALVDTPDSALVHAREAIRLDRGDHTGHIVLLRLLSRAGQREAAEAQYAVSMRQLESAGGSTAPLVFAWRDLSRPRPSADDVDASVASVMAGVTGQPGSVPEADARSETATPPEG